MTGPTKATELSELIASFYADVKNHLGALVTTDNVDQTVEAILGAIAGAVAGVMLVIPKLRRYPAIISALAALATRLMRTKKTIVNV